MGVVAIIGLVMLFIYWSEPAKRGVWIIVFAVSLLISLSLFIYAVTRAVRKVQEVGNIISAQVKKDMERKDRDIWHDDRSYLMEGDRNYAQLELLQSYEPDSMKGKVDPEFYTYFGYRDWHRFPVTYPYSIQSTDTYEYGVLYDDSRVVNFKDPNAHDNSESQLFDITRFSFDKNLLLLKIAENRDQAGTTEREKYKYLIYYFVDGKREEFKTEEEMFVRAEKLGFSGRDSLMSLEEYNEFF